MGKAVVEDAEIQRKEEEGAKPVPSWYVQVYGT
jgi:hypothetical protein